MADAGKYGTLDGLVDLTHIGYDEPIFLLRARDATAAIILEHYASTADTIGAPESHVEGLGEVIRKFRTWQASHPIHIPGT